MFETDEDTLAEEYVNRISVTQLSGTWQVPEDGHCMLDAGEDGSAEYGITFTDDDTVEFYNYIDTENKERESTPLMVLSRAE